MRLLGSPAYRGWRGASSDERHVLVAWVPAEQRGLVPVGPRGEERSGRGHRCVPGLLQEGPGGLGLRKGDRIGPQTEGREKQQGAGDRARGDAASQAFELPCRLEAKH